MPPMLSVVIACRNAETTLGVQLEALAREPRHSEWDILLCDNGSTDNTVAVAESYRARLPRLHVIAAHEQPGPAYARNVGAAQSQARWLAFVDADDEIAPGWIDAMFAALDAHAFVAGRFEPTRLNTPAVLRSRPLQQDRGLQDSGIGPRLPHAGAGNMGIHRNVFQAVGGFDVDLGCLEDTDFCWRVQLAGVPLVFWPDAVVHVRLRSTIRRMWGQGRNYGAATAELEHRYAGVTRAALPPGGSPVEPAADDAAERGGTLLGLLRGARTPGALIWSLGWHAGHRAWRPATRQGATRTPQAA
jgi:glycosyltransferase involved in cell wall biosynthesis